MSKKVEKAIQIRKKRQKNGKPSVCVRQGRIGEQHLWRKTGQNKKSSVFLASVSVISSEKSYSFILDRFLIHQKSMVKESTYAHYCNIINAHIRPVLGTLSLQQFNGSLIEEFAAEKLKNGRKDGKGGLSPKTVKDMLSIIRLSLQYAENNGFVFPNALFFSTPKSTAQSIQVLSADEQRRLESIADGNLDCERFGVRLCLYTGLRIGELCALKWSDIDLENALIQINHTILRIQNTDEDANSKTKILITSPKTKAGKRQIPLPSFLLEAMLLRKQYIHPAEDDYFLTGTSHYIEPSDYYKKYKRWLQACALPNYSFHALRHTFATRCIECGFDPKSLSEILGHASVNITLNLYVHPSMKLKRCHMEKLAIESAAHIENAAI